MSEQLKNSTSSETIKKINETEAYKAVMSTAKTIANLRVSSGLFYNINVLITLASFVVFIIWAFGSTKSFYYHVAESGVIGSISLISTKIIVLFITFIIKFNNTIKTNDINMNTSNSTNINTSNITNMNPSNNTSVIIDDVILALSIIIDIHLFSYFWQILEKYKRVFKMKYDPNTTLNLSIFLYSVLASALQDEYHFIWIIAVYTVLSNAFLYYFKRIYDENNTEQNIK